MTILPILFWVFVALSLCGFFFPQWPAPARFGPFLFLLVLLGLRVFPIPLQ